jgi:hypothetical protein
METTKRPAPIKLKFSKIRPGDNGFKFSKIRPGDNGFKFSKMSQAQMGKAMRRGLRFATGGNT